MNREKKYRLAIWILSLVVIIEGLFIFILARPKRILPPPQAIKGKIAIVLDDWGYNLNNLYILDRIKYPLTASVLPHLNYSVQVAEELHHRGLEIILHLPMEPREKYRLEKNTILTSMNEAAISKIINSDLKDIPYVKGLSNHMGSRATQDLKTMEIVFKELKQRRLYFLDSLVSSKSVGFALAGKMHLGFARRGVFLDNTEEAGYIRGQIYKLKMQASMRGSAIGIGHDKKVTLEVLAEVMPQLEKEGYVFVFVSELVR